MAIIRDRWSTNTNANDNHRLVVPGLYWVICQEEGMQSTCKMTTVPLSHFKSDLCRCSPSQTSCLSMPILWRLFKSSSLKTIQIHRCRALTNPKRVYLYLASSKNSLARRKANRNFDEFFCVQVLTCRLSEKDTVQLVSCCVQRTRPVWPQ